MSLARAAAISVAGLVFLSVAFAPLWIAERVEANRKAQLKVQAAKLRDAKSLTICPGNVEAFLQASAKQNGSPSIWIPGCRAADAVPSGRVAVVVLGEDSLNECQAALRRGVPIGCQFDPEVSFLAEPQAAVSMARLKVESPSGENVLWVTAPLSWREHLAARCRLWLMGGWLALALLSFLLMTEKRARTLRYTYARPLVGAPPRVAEWLLLGWTAHKAQPDDLREEYLHVMHEDKMNAAVWYWSQVLRSLPALIFLRLFGERSERRRASLQ